MLPSELNAVTGAFGFTGKHIARRLLEAGKAVRTLTGHPHRHDPFAGRVSAAPLDFDRPDDLMRDLRGAEVLFNTYWVRFPHGRMTYEWAVENTRVLIRAAEAAGVRRMVHISITNASAESPLPYFRGKGLIEQAIKESRLSWAIIRPTVIFGAEGILIHNIAWLLRWFPVFAVPGDGRYRLQPVFVEDVADMAVTASGGKENVIVDAAGPETYTFDELVRLVAARIRSWAAIIHVLPSHALAMSGLVGKLVNDVVLTEDEIRGLMANLLVSSGPSAGSKKLSEWLSENADNVGRRYLSEIGRHYR